MVDSNFDEWYFTMGENGMNKRIRSTLSLGAAAVIMLLAAPVHPVSAQYVISARAGLVNYTTGPVNYRSSTESTWREIPTHLQLSEGDRLRTEAWGKAEILLNPGSYLRIGNSSEITALSTDLSAISLELSSGSAILEVGNLQDAVIALQTPTTRVRVEKDGLYRIDVTPDATALTVRKGEAFFEQADGSFKKVKSDKSARVTVRDHEIAKLDDRQEDEFNLWSADRAELLVAANQALGLRRGYWGGLVSFQSAWLYDPFYGCYTFFPWGFAFRSIYGYGYYDACDYWSRRYHLGHGGGSSGSDPQPKHDPPPTRERSLHTRDRSLSIRTLSPGLDRASRPSIGASSTGTRSSLPVRSGQASEETIRRTPSGQGTPARMGDTPGRMGNSPTRPAEGNSSRGSGPERPEDNSSRESGPERPDTVRDGHIGSGHGSIR
jgi:hypothetical protein